MANKACHQNDTCMCIFIATTALSCFQHCFNYRQKQIQQIAVLMQCTILFCDCQNISRTLIERHVSVASTKLNQRIPGAAMGCSCGLSLFGEKMFIELRTQRLRKSRNGNDATALIASKMLSYFLLRESFLLLED